MAELCRVCMSRATRAGSWISRPGGLPRRAAALAIMLAAIGAIAPRAARGQPLDRRVSDALAQAHLGGARVGVSVLDCSTGQSLVKIDSRGKSAGDGYVPASNLKLFTSGAAFLVLGKDFEFQTKVIADGDRLIVQGAGDPAFAEPKLLEDMRLSVDQFVDRLVDSIKSANLSPIREIVVDDRVFDREYVHPDWPRDQLNLSYCAGVSGVNFHANLLNVYVAPGSRAGDEAQARTEPGGSWITLRRIARTVREGNTEVWLEREPSPPAEPFSFRLHGTVRAAVTEPVRVTVDQPGLFFGRVLADRAGRAGLGNGTAPITARLVGANETFSDPSVQRVVTVVRTPLGVALERCNVDSENLYAEALCKLIGHRVTGQPGTWGSGTAVVRMQIKDKLGAEAVGGGGLVLADGSGLSRNNRITPEVMTKWLRALAAEPGGEAFVSSLAVAGEEGTLRKRFHGKRLHNDVRAKSGYIREVRTLSGYVSNPSTGRRIAFSVLVNNVPSGSDGSAKQFHEAVVEAVDQYLFERSKETAGVGEK